jgi:DNA polymerase-3 subunit delta
LIQGPEDLLADRAQDRLVRLARQEHPDAELAVLDAAAPAQSLVGAASGSLFSPYAVVVAAGVDKASDEFLEEALAYVARPNPDAMVIFRHGGGTRGKKLLDALKAAKAHQVNAGALRSDRDKEAFVAAEFRRFERTFHPETLRALVQAVGLDLRELASAVKQVAADTVGRVTPEMVERYYGDRLETTAFKVADAAATGQTGEALRLARYAMGSGLDPVVLISALASRLRVLAKVGWAVQARADPAAELGLPSWQVTQAKGMLRHWDATGLARSIEAVAQADAQVKGLGGASAKTARYYAVERAIIAVSQAAGGA